MPKLASELAEQGSDGAKATVAETLRSDTPLQRNPRRVDARTVVGGTPVGQRA